MQQIVDGVLRFQEEVFQQHAALFGQLANQQDPDVLFITCSDSRIDPNLLTQSRPGDLFICRNAGNIVPPHSKETGGMTASIEYAVAVLNVRHIVICGHTDCGAMKGVQNVESLDELPHVKEWLGHCRSAKEVVRARHSCCGENELGALTEENVVQQLQHLRTHPVVAAKIATGALQLHGWIYNIETGAVTCNDGSHDGFTSLKSYYESSK